MTFCGADLFVVSETDQHSVKISTLEKVQLFFLQKKINEMLIIATSKSTELPIPETPTSSPPDSYYRETCYAGNSDYRIKIP
jgi:hypothetical protein